MVHKARFSPHSCLGIKGTTSNPLSNSSISYEAILVVQNGYRQRFSNAYDLFCLPQHWYVEHYTHAGFWMLAPHVTGHMFIHFILLQCKPNTEGSPLVHSSSAIAVVAQMCHRVRAQALRLGHCQASTWMHMFSAALQLMQTTESMAEFWGGMAGSAPVGGRETGWDELCSSESRASVEGILPIHWGFLSVPGKSFPFPECSLPLSKQQAATAAACLPTACLF